MASFFRGIQGAMQSIMTPVSTSNTTNTNTGKEGHGGGERGDTGTSAHTRPMTRNANAGGTSRKSLVNDGPAANARKKGERAQGLAAALVAAPATNGVHANAGTPRAGRGAAAADGKAATQRKPRPTTAPPSSGGSGSQAGSGKIRVFVRVRPLSSSERQTPARHFSVVDVSDCNREVSLNEFCSSSNDYLRQRRVKQRRYRYDGVFDENSAQHDVFSSTAEPLVEAVLRGRNACCFCYGATGAGKTFTMLGTEANPGVMVLALQLLFSKIRDDRGEQDDGGDPSDDGDEWKEVKLTYLEIYNETVRDLLDTSNDHDGCNDQGDESNNFNDAFGNLSASGPNAAGNASGNRQPTLHMREDPIAGVVVQGLTQVHASSADEVMSLLQAGNGRRTTESTRSNETSSRSHAVLQAIVYTYRRTRGQTVVANTSKLSLIDLAGSERTLASESKQSARCVEGANINKSLLALSGCINALVAGKKHIPYRNSKLTQLLKDSLGGGCVTAMIANVSPSAFVFSETSNTLHWADRAKQIRVSSRNISNTSNAHQASAVLAGGAGAVLAGGADAGAGNVPLDMQKLISSLEEQNRVMSEKIRQLEAKAAAHGDEGAVDRKTIEANPSGRDTTSRPRPMTAMAATTLNPVSKTKALISEMDANAPGVSQAQNKKAYNTRQQARRHSIAFAGPPAATGAKSQKVHHTKAFDAGTATNGTNGNNNVAAAGEKLVSDLRAEIAALRSKAEAESKTRSAEVKSMAAKHKCELEQLKREFQMKVKHKDDFIRTLITSNGGGNGNDDPCDVTMGVENEAPPPLSPPVTRSTSHRLMAVDAAEKAPKSVTSKGITPRAAGARSGAVRRNLNAANESIEKDGEGGKGGEKPMHDLKLRLSTLSKRNKTAKANSKSLSMKGIGNSNGSVTKKRPFREVSNTDAAGVY